MSCPSEPARIARAVFLLVLLAPVPALGSEVSEMYARLYERAYTLQQKQEIMVAIEEQDDPDLASFLGAALEALISTQRAVTGATDRSIHAQLMRMVVRKLGGLRARDAAPLVLEAAEETTDPVLKAEALAALGSIGIPSYAEKIAAILRGLNLNPGGDRQAAETVASGCIEALERLREKAGFVPVFDASLGWYSRRVKDAAAAALAVMVEDPSEMLAGIVRTDPSFEAMLRAMEFSAASSAPAEGRIRVALAGLEQAMIRGGRNATEETALSRIRTTAAAVLRDLKADSREAVPMLRTVLFSESAPSGEKMTILEALGASGSAEGAAVLIAYLKWHNDRKESGIQPKDERLLRSVIVILGGMARQEAAGELVRVKTLGYALGPVHDAEAALAKLGW